MISKLKGISIKAVASALPEGQLTLSNFSDMFGEREAARIAKSTGISGVRIAGDSSSVDLAYAASCSLFDQADVDPYSIDAVVFVTQTPDALMPGSSALLAARLGLRSNIVAFDLNFGCSGYVYGLFQASMLVSNAGFRRVLVCTSDVITNLLNPADRHVRMVFGDGASATLVEMGDHDSRFLFDTNGNGAKHLGTPITYLNSGDYEKTARAEVGSLFMDGAQVMNFALDRVPSMIREFLTCAEVSSSEVPYFILHQANAFMLHYLGRKLEIEPSRIPVFVDGVGNTGPSSIPILLSCSPDNSRFCLDNLVFCGFGVGLSVAIGMFSLKGTKLISPVIVNS